MIRADIYMGMGKSMFDTRHSTDAAFLLFAHRVQLWMMTRKLAFSLVNTIGMIFDIFMAFRRRARNFVGMHGWIEYPVVCHTVSES